jgi:hypothetical protein
LQYATALCRPYPARRELGVSPPHLYAHEEAVELLGRNPRRPGAAERVEDKIALHARSKHGAAHETKGFLGGWRPWDFSLMGTAGMRQTEETWEVGSGPFMRS